MRNFFQLAFFLWGSSCAMYAQDSTNMQQYFNDGRKHDLLHHAFKVGITPFLNGEANLYYEYTPFKLINIELGAGLLLPYRTFSTWTEANIPYPTHGGYNLQAYLKIMPFVFRQSFWIQKSTFFVGVKQAWLNIDAGYTFVLRNYMIGTGFVAPLTNHWQLGLDISFGYSVVLPESHLPSYFRYDPSEPLTPVGPVDFKLIFAF